MVVDWIYILVLLQFASFFSPDLHLTVYRWPLAVGFIDQIVRTLSETEIYFSNPIHAIQSHIRLWIGVVCACAHSPNCRYSQNIVQVEWN